VVEINPEETPLSGRVHDAIRERATVALEALWSMLES
jgi:hypothetical protein